MNKNHFWKDWYENMHLAVASVGSKLYELQQRKDVIDNFALLIKLKDLEKIVSKWFRLLDHHILKKNYKPLSPTAIQNSKESFLKLEEEIFELQDLQDHPLNVDTILSIDKLERSARHLINLFNLID